MTQIVRKFVLLSIIITLIIIFLDVVINYKIDILEEFGIRDSNGKRTNLLRKCMGSTSKDIIYQNEECTLESFISRISDNTKDEKDSENSLDNRAINLFNIGLSSDENISKHIINQIPSLFKTKDISYLFKDIKTNKTDRRLMARKIKPNICNIKFIKPINLLKIENGLIKVIKDNMKELSIHYNNFNKNQKAEFDKIFFKEVILLINIKINDNYFLLNPRVNLKKKNFVTSFQNNNELLLYVNTIQKTDTKKIYDLNIETINEDIDFKKIEIEFGLFDLGNVKEFIPCHSLIFKFNII